MNKRDLQNEKPDKFGRELLAAAKVPDAEIEKIVTAPQLFQRVRANIEAEKSRRQTKSIFTVPNFQFWNWQKLGLAFAVLAVLIFGAAIFSFRISPPETAKQAAVEEPPVLESAKPPDEILPPQNSPDDFQPRRIAARTKIKKQSLTSQNSARKSKVSPPSKIENQTDAPFVALTFAGDFDERDERQIVRVEMSRSKLLALGVAVQTENEGERIKADLLVGADGVARAIRLVQ